MAQEGRHILSASLALNALLLCGWIYWAVTFQWRPDLTQKATLDFSRGHEKQSSSPAVEFEYRSPNINDPRFRGTPGHEWEESMHELMAGTLIRISEEEIETHEHNAIQVEGGGYAAGLGVAHNLHCVKKLKKYLYRDVFYADLDPNGEEMAEVQDHADHCLEWLRQAVLCQIDISMYTLVWVKEDGKYVTAHGPPGPQKCVNWDRLHDWMKQRAVSQRQLIPP